MLDPLHLQNTLQTLLAGHMDLTIYGHGSWGRTKLLRSKLNQNFGTNNYLYVNTLVAWDRNAFFYVLNSEFCRVIKELFPETKLTLGLQNRLKKNQEFFQTLDQWIKMMNNFIEEEPELFQSVERLYIIFDNIEEMLLTANFLTLFHKACKTQIENFKFSFIFSGSHLKGRELTNQEPFRRIITLFLPRPEMRSTIIQGVDYAQNWTMEVPELNKLRESVISHLYMKFEILENDHNRARQISKQLMQQSIDSFHGNYENVRTFLRNDGLQNLSKPLIENGPTVSKHEKSQKTQEHLSLHERMEQPLKKYPYLIATSIFLANGYPESEDRRRFLEYKRKRAKVVKNRKITTTANAFKKNQTICRHNIHRINAICQSLEDQAEKYFPQSRMPHHSLDYYGCFEYLRDERKIEYHGKSSANNWGKLRGEVKEEQIRNFLRSINLKMSQFTDLDD